MASPSSSKQSLWVVVALLVVIGILFVANRFAAPADDGIRIVPGPKSAPAAAAPAEPAESESQRAANDERLEVCRAKLKIAAEAGILHNMNFDGGRPKVWVGRTWHQMSIEQKQGLAETAACFFVAGRDGPGGKAITFPIFDGFSGRQIATWKFTRLDVE